VRVAPIQTASDQGLFPGGNNQGLFPGGNNKPTTWVSVANTVLGAYELSVCIL